MQLHSVHGNKWSRIAKNMPTKRTGYAVRNRYNSLRKHNGSSHCPASFKRPRPQDENGAGLATAALSVMAAAGPILPAAAIGGTAMDDSKRLRFGGEHPSIVPVVGRLGGRGEPRPLTNLRMGGEMMGINVPLPTSTIHPAAPMPPWPVVSPVSYDSRSFTNYHHHQQQFRPPPRLHLPPHSFIPSHNIPPQPSIKPTYSYHPPPVHDVKLEPNTLS